MRQFEIAKGLVISTQGGHFEFTDRTANEYYFQSLDSGQRIIIQDREFWAELEKGNLNVLKSQASESVLVTNNVNQEPLPLISDLPDKYLEELQRILHYVKGIQKEGISRGCREKIKSVIPKLAAEIQDDAAPSASTVQTWLLKFETAIEPNLEVLNKNAFRSRSKGLDDESERFLQDQIQLHYAQLTRPSIADAYRQYIKSLVLENKTRASQDQQTIQRASSKTFYNRVQELPQKELLISRYGFEYARKQLKVSLGHLPADFPLDVVEIDHTLMNLYVIDDISYLPLGRPWVTAIKDRHSNVLLGFYISFHAGGLQAIFGAIKHSLRSHQKAYEIWPELENPWTAFGLGSIYCSDRGKDFMSPQYRRALLDLGASYELCERRTPWLKGSIERFFLTLEQTFFETLPGKTFNSLANRKDYDPLKHAVIRFSTLVFLIHKWAVDYHNVTPHSRKLVTPIELWNEGIGIAPPPFPASTQSLDIIFGERNQGKVRNEGIQYLGLHYADPGLQDIVNDLGRGFTAEYIVSNENLGFINLKHPRTGQYVRVNCTRPDYANGMSVFQHKYLMHEAKLYSKSNHSIDQLLNVRAVIEDKIREDVALKDSVHKKKLGRIAGINSNAVLDSKPRTTTAAFPDSTKQTTENPSATELSEKEYTFTSIPSYNWG